MPGQSDINRSVNDFLGWPEILIAVRAWRPHVSESFIPPPSQPVRRAQLHVSQADWSREGNKTFRAASVQPHANVYDSSAGLPLLELLLHSYRAAVWGSVVCGPPGRPDHALILVHIYNQWSERRRLDHLNIMEGKSANHHNFWVSL